MASCSVHVVTLEKKLEVIAMLKDFRGSFRGGGGGGGAGGTRPP